MRDHEQHSKECAFIPLAFSLELKVGLDHSFHVVRRLRSVNAGEMWQEERGPKPSLPAPATPVH